MKMQNEHKGQTEKPLCIILMLVSLTVPQNNIKQQQFKVAGEGELRGGMDLKG